MVDKANECGPNIEPFLNDSIAAMQFWACNRRKSIGRSAGTVT